MKKLTIAITDEAHIELLKIQLQKRVAKNEKKSLAIVAAEVLHEVLVEKKNPAL